MLKATVGLTNRLGLHARAAAQLVRLANAFSSEITLHRLDTNVTANAKSILSVLSLSASQGVGLRVIADGADEKEAIERITQLFADQFGED
jgi:phosphocarrier protein HPr